MTTHILLLFIIFLYSPSDVCLFSVSTSGALIFYNRQDKKILIGIYLVPTSSPTTLLGDQF